MDGTMRAAVAAKGGDRALKKNEEEKRNDEGKMVRLRRLRLLQVPRLTLLPLPRPLILKVGALFNSRHFYGAVAKAVTVTDGYG